MSLFQRKEPEPSVAEEIRRNIVSSGKRLAKSGLIVRTWGNLSARDQVIDFKDQYFFITASGRDYQRLTPEEVVRVRMFDLSWKGQYRPSSETMLHRELYRVRPEAKVIVHTHQTCASALGCGGDPEILLPDQKTSVKVAEYGRSGSEELAQSVADAARGVKGMPAVIMKHHGVVCWGEDFDHAFQTAQALEGAARRKLEELGIPTDGKRTVKIARDEIRNSKFPATMEPYLDDFAMMIGPSLPLDRSGAEKGSALGMWLDEAGVLRGSEESRESDRKAMELLLQKNAIAMLAARILDGTSLDRQSAESLHRKYREDYSTLSK